MTADTEAQGGSLADNAVQVVQSLIKNALRMAEETSGLGKEPRPGSAAALELKQEHSLVDEWTDKPVFDCY